MTNQQIIDYLNQNKDKFSLDQLKQGLISSGYSEADINEAIQIVSGATPQVPQTQPTQLTQPVSPQQPQFQQPVQPQYQQSQFQQPTQPKKKRRWGCFGCLFLIIATIFYIWGWPAINNYIANRQKEVEVKPTSFDLIDQDLQDGKISIDDAVKNKFYAVFETEKLNSKYKSDEFVQHPDLDFELEKHASQLKPETLKEIIPYIIPPKIQYDHIMIKEGEKYRTIKGDTSSNDLDSSLIPKAEAAKFYEQALLNRVLASENFVFYYSLKGPMAVKDENYVKQMANDFEYALQEYIKWGYKKPKVIYNPLASPLPIQLLSLPKDVYSLLNNKIPVYVVNPLPPSDPNLLGFQLNEIGALQGLIPLLSVFMSDIDMGLEMASNIVYPSLTIYAKNIKKASQKLKINERDILKDVFYHEIFHIAQAGIRDDTDKWWTEVTAQWAILQLRPKTILLPKIFLPKFFKKPEGSLDGGEEYSFGYYVYPFAEFVSQLFGRDAILNTLKHKNVLSQINNLASAKNSSFSQFFHNFAIKNWLLDYEKPGITRTPKKPKIFTTLIPGKNETIKPKLNYAATNYVMIKPQKKDITAEISVEGTKFNDQFMVTALGTTNGKKFDKLDTYNIQDRKTINFQSSKYKAIVLVVTNGSYEKGTSVNYKIAIVDSSLAKDIKQVNGNLGQASCTKIYYKGFFQFLTLLSEGWSKEMKKFESFSLEGTVLNDSAIDIKQQFGDSSTEFEKSAEEFRELGQEFGDRGANVCISQISGAFDPRKLHNQIIDNIKGFKIKVADFEQSQDNPNDYFSFVVKPALRRQNFELSLINTSSEGNSLINVTFE